MEKEDSSENALEDVHSQISISELVKKLHMLEKEKKDIEDDFGRKRARLKELYLQKEEELMQERQHFTSAAGEKEELLRQVDRLQKELDDARSQVIVAEYTKENEIETERRKCREEIATLQQLRQECFDDATQAQQMLEKEIKRLSFMNAKLENDLQELKKEQPLEKESSSLGPGMLSAVTKTIVRKVGSLNPNNSSSSTENLQENLEESMRKVNKYAQEDAEVLRSLVVPLEEEIKALKDKLRSADEELQKYITREAARSVNASGEPAAGKPVSDAASEIDEKLKEALHDLKVEKASRADLEMYASILSTKNSTLQKNYEKMHAELKDVLALLGDERRRHSELKNTWQHANDQFLEAQRLQMQDMQRMKSLLTADQVKQLEEMKRDDEKERRLAEESWKVESAKDNGTNGCEIKIEKPSGDSETVSPALQIMSPSLPVCLEQREKSPVESFGSDDNETARQLPVPEGKTLFDKLLSTPGNVPEPLSLNSSLESAGRISRWSPEKLPILTEDQYQALTDLKPELDAYQETIDSARSFENVVPAGKRLVSDREWALLQEAMKSTRDKLGERCNSCANLEVQLAKSQASLKDAEKAQKMLQKTVDRYKDELVRDSNYRKEMDEKWNSKSEEHAKEVTDLMSKLVAAEKVLRELQGNFSQHMGDIQNKVQELSIDREKIQKELTRLQSHNDRLIGKHTASAEALQNEVIDLPNTVDELHLLVLKYRDDLITAKIAKEHLEDTLKSENLFLREQLQGEHNVKQELENDLTNEIDSLRGELGIAQSMRAQYEEEHRSNQELRARLSSCENKHKQVVSERHRLQEEYKVYKNKTENDLATLKGRVSSLQQDLDNSEAVQKDFVRLSQTLQMQLESFRGEQTEVRWQHEEDVDDCNNCKQNFVMTRRKHHCRHCGRIFCTDCLTRSVPSGPHGRPAKVCDVCHTLLVKDTAPYFSTELPPSSD